ncbi:hypothetical protein AVEN_83667-1 [Araneus ventricosus]|uniref:Uncharacterized protein n=1 Tax=Araneus ventricosus TaxID=182803 RepID=A0A4Y2EVB6_ARAVE|nr:hypothetical protein AVEN_83667-1 [Araneus ventricosus]
MKVSKVRRVFMEPLGSNSRRVGCRIVLLELSQSVGMHDGHEMSVGDRTGCLSTCRLSQSFLDVSGVPYHANCTRPIPSQRLHKIEQSPVDKQGLWVKDVVSILVHVHPPDTIGNETRQTR